MDKLISQFIDLIQTHYENIPPIFSVLKKEYPSFSWIIEKNGGYLHFKKLGGYEPKERKPPNYWNNWDNLKEAINSLIKNENFPTIETIRSKLGNGIVKSIYKFGGIRSVAEKMGYDLRSYFKTSDGHYVQSSYEYGFDEFLFYNHIPHEVNGLINTKYNYRYDFKIYDYYVEIWGYKTRINNNRCLKYDKKRREKEKIYKELNMKLISLEVNDFKEENKQILLEKISPIMSYCGSGGIDKIYNCIKPAKYWDYKNTIKEFELLIEKLGHFPNTKNLEIDRGLKYAISKYGGLQHFKAIFNQPLMNRWTNETILHALQEISKQTGHFPTTTELSKKNSGLLDAIQRHGGISKYRNLLGYAIIRKHWTEEDVISEMRKIKVLLGRNPKTTDLIKTPIHCAIYRQNKNLKYFIDKL